MARKTVYIPDELLELVEQTSERDLNLSAEFQRFLRARLDASIPKRKRGSAPGRVRAMTDDDIQQVLGLWDEQESGEAIEALTPMARKLIARNLERTLSEADAFCLVAEIDNKVVGFVTAAIVGHPVMPGRIAEIEELHVATSHRRQGVATELLSEAMRWLSNAGVVRMRAHVELDRATAVVPLFRSLGWLDDQVALNVWAPSVSPAR